MHKIHQKYIEHTKYYLYFFLQFLNPLIFCKLFCHHRDLLIGPKKIVDKSAAQLECVRNVRETDKL